MEHVTSGLTYIIDAFMMFAPCSSFFIQISKIKKTETSEGFSKIIVLILLMANILRIFFWFGKRFSFVLLVQSILMIATQFYLLYVCLKYSDSNKQIKKLSSKQKDTLSEYAPSLTLNNFWNWSRYIDYVYFILFIIIFFTVLSNLIGFDNFYYVEFIGSLAAGVEAIIGVPQVITNYQDKSTGSLSVGMILLWLLGDSFKTIYFISNESPVQLIYCGVFQLLIDIVIIYQIVTYDKEFKKEIKNGKYHELNNNDSISTKVETIEDDIEVI
jgi:hypothetical protein